MEMLQVYQNIPITLEILKKNNTPKTIKFLSKSENEHIKSLAKDIVDKWVKKISRKPDSSRDTNSQQRDKDKDKHHSHHHHHSSSRSHKDSSNNKEKSKENTDNISPEKSSSKKERHSSTESSQSTSSKSSSSTKSKDEQPRNAKVSTSLHRSTGLEQETVLPPPKKKSTISVVDQEKVLAATKRPSNGKPILSSQVVLLP